MRIQSNVGVWQISSCDILEKVNAINKLFKKFEKFRLNIDKHLYKKAKYDASKLITTKKQASLK